METLLNETTYIFFLKLNKKLPDFYFDLVYHFSDFGFTLVPIEAESLKDISYISKKYILLIRYDLESQATFNKVCSDYLTFLLKNSKVYVNDFSSFAQMQIIRTQAIIKNYNYRPLPMEFREIVVRLIHSVIKDKEANMKWPGGKRGKLPEMPR